VIIKVKKTISYRVVDKKMYRRCSLRHTPLSIYQTFKEREYSSGDLKPKLSN
jgi:hypothetical protein